MMNIKERLLSRDSIKTFVYTTFVLILFSGSALFLSAQTLGVGGKYALITPTNIPITASGASNIGIFRLDLEETGTTTDAYVNRIIVRRATGPGPDNLDHTHISGVRIYINQSTPRKFRATYLDPPETNAGEIPASSVSISKPNNTTIQIDIDDDASVIPKGSEWTVWIAFDYAGTTPTESIVSYYVESVYYHASQGVVDPGTHVDPGVFGAPTPSSKVNRLSVTMSGEGKQIAPAEQEQGTENILMMALTFGDFGLDETVNKLIDTIKLTYVGTNSADIITGGVSLYLDNGNGVFDDDILIDPWLDTKSIVGGVVTFDPPASDNVKFGGDPDPVTMPYQKSYLVLATLKSDAVVGHTVGFRVADPSTDVTFADSYTDDGGDLRGEYLQIGYISDTTSEPPSNYEFTVIPGDVPGPPSVLDTDPDNGGFDVETDSLIKIIFSEGMDIASVETKANYTIENITSSYTFTDTDFAITYNSNLFTVTINPSSELDWASTYQVTVVGPGGVKDYKLNDMVADYPFSFTTRKQYPDFTEPAVIKNRIGSDANSEALIFVPQPPGGASSRVSIQVFTTTGKLVRTFYRNVPWSDIGAAPISWDGTNDRGQDLGPGMYFVQVRTESYKRVLKVMIVR